MGRLRINKAITREGEARTVLMLEEDRRNSFAAMAAVTLTFRERVKLAFAILRGTTTTLDLEE
jgi:hypothetical protein